MLVRAEASIGTVTVKPGLSVKDFTGRRKGRRRQQVPHEQISEFWLGLGKPLEAWPGCWVGWDKVKGSIRGGG